MITARKAAMLLTVLSVLFIIAPSTAAAADPDVGNFTEINNFTDRSIGGAEGPPDPNINKTFIQYNESEGTVIFRVELNNSWTPNQQTAVFIDEDENRETGVNSDTISDSQFYENLDAMGADYRILAGEAEDTNYTAAWNDDGGGEWDGSTAATDGADTNISVNKNNITLQVNESVVDGDGDGIFNFKFAHIDSGGKYVWAPDPGNNDNESTTYDLDNKEIVTETSVETMVEFEEGANNPINGPLAINITLSEGGTQIDSDTLEFSSPNETDSVEFGVSADEFDGEQGDQVSVNIDENSVDNPGDYELNETSNGSLNPSEGQTTTSAFKIEDATTKSANLTNATGIVETNYPVIQSFVTVDSKNGSDGSLNNTANYTIDDGEFIDSSGDTEPVEFVQDRDQPTPTDIVFVIDRTNDMGNEIEKIRDELKNMNNSLSNSREDIRYGLVTFADSEIEVSEPFTRDIDKINNTLDTLGTNDNVVSQYNYEALDKGLNELNYRPEAQQVVINAIDDGVDIRDQTPAQSEIQTQIETRGINYIAISPGDQETANLSTAVNGQQYDIKNTGDAMSNITKSLNQTYILSYTTDDKTLSDTRTVEIEADHSLSGENSSTGTTTYTTPDEFVGVWGVDSSTFPTINTFATIDTEETAINQGALATNDFRAFRNTDTGGLAAQEINTVEYVQDTDDTPTEIVFVVDQTTGQEAAATTIEDEVQSIEQTLESNGRTVEFGLFSYKDNILSERQPLTTSGADVSDAAGELKFKSLSDPDRYSYDALNKSIEDTEFDQSAQKMIIHITDAPADIPDSTATSDDLYETNQSDLERKFKRQGIKYAAISPDAADSNSMTQLAENTNGEWYGSDFDAALDEIETELTETYIIEYESDATVDTAPDRDVRITAGFREPDITGVGTDTGVYYLDNKPTVTLSANKTTLTPGDSARVNVTVDPRGISDLETAEANISFDPTEYDVSPDSIENGTLIGEADNSSRVSNATGYVFLNQTNTTAAGTTNESGRLGSFILEANTTALATSELQFNNATVGNVSDPDLRGVELAREQPVFETDLDVETDDIQRESSVAPGDTFTVNVTVEDNGHKFVGIGHVLEYNQSVLNATAVNGDGVSVDAGRQSVPEGHVLTADGSGTSRFAEKSSSGAIAYDEYRFTTPITGIAENGTLYNVTFEVTADSDLSGTINTTIEQRINDITTAERPADVTANLSESEVAIEGEMVAVQGEFEINGLHEGAPLRMTVSATSPGSVQNISLRNSSGATVVSASCDVESEGCEKSLEYTPTNSDSLDSDGDVYRAGGENITIVANTTDGETATQNKSAEIAVRGDVDRRGAFVFGRNLVEVGDALAILGDDSYRSETDTLPWNETDTATDPGVRAKRDLNNDGTIDADDVNIVIEELP